jgi:hypothetical protein
MSNQQLPTLHQACVSEDALGNANNLQHSASRIWQQLKTGRTSALQPLAWQISAAEMTVCEFEIAPV